MTSPTKASNRSLAASSFPFLSSSPIALPTALKASTRRFDRDDQGIVAGALDDGRGAGGHSARVQELGINRQARELFLGVQVAIGQEAGVRRALHQPRDSRIALVPALLGERLGDTHHPRRRPHLKPTGGTADEVAALCSQRQAELVECVRPAFRKGTRFVKARYQIVYHFPRQHCAPFICNQIVSGRISGRIKGVHPVGVCGR